MRPFYPPQVDFKRPKLETVLAFLTSHGWEVDKQTKDALLVKPPDETRTNEEGGFRYHVPIQFIAGVNDEATFAMVETFAEIFEIPLQDLFDLLSMSLDDIKEKLASTPRMVKMQKAMLAQAS